ncbi:MAG: hypothetical protein AAFQ63_12820 [Cyanobacteria bacterium J06621_11]
MRNAKHRRYALLCVGIAFIVAIAQPMLTGKIYSEAQSIQLLEGIKSSSLYLGSAIATASATTLALMLTLLSIASQADTSFEYNTYKGIELIGRISTATFIGAVIQLLLLSFPIGEFKDIEPIWFKGLYYLLSTTNGLLVGLMVVGVLVLLDTITTLIKELSPDIN